MNAQTKPELLKMGDENSGELFDKN